MSISTTANYGGRIDTVQGNIKQFIFSDDSTANWIYKRIDGLVLVQTPANPTTPLLINNNLTIKGNLIVQGSIVNPSDERLKNNMNNISLEASNKLLSLNPITFQYKNDIKQITHYGLSAQEVETLFPELVSHNSQGYKLVNYQEFVPIMIVKMKDMQEQINYLKSILNINKCIL